MDNESKEGIDKLKGRIEKMPDCDTKKKILKDIEKKKEQTVLK
ncbi:MAG: hypothetical protein ACI9N9_000011 [Enterobacterales bacterium]|jgi:hypothetical protein